MSMLRIRSGGSELAPKGYAWFVIENWNKPRIKLLKGKADGINSFSDLKSARVVLAVLAKAKIKRLRKLIQDPTSIRVVRPKRGGE